MPEEEDEEDEERDIMVTQTEDQYTYDGNLLNGSQAPSICKKKTSECTTV